jgi:hypothetical protein
MVAWRGAGRRLNKRAVRADRAGRVVDLLFDFGAERLYGALIADYAP